MKSALRAAGEKATLVALPGMEDYASISISIEPESGMTLFFNVRLECPPSKYESEELDGFRSDVARSPSSFSLPPRTHTRGSRTSRTCSACSPAG